MNRLSIAVCFGFVVIAGCLPSPKSDTTNNEKELQAKSNETSTDKSSENENVAGKPTSLDKPTGTDKRPMPSSGPAIELFQACTAKYRSLKSYEDRGLIRYRIGSANGGEPMLNDTINFRIAFERPNRLAMQVNNMSACWSGTNWEAIVRSNGTGPFGNQRLVRPLPQSMDLAWLLTPDLISLVAPLPVGHPMQLEMLLNPNPLDLLQSTETVFSLLTPDLFDSQQCDRLEIAHRDLKWIMWISKQDKLLRKVELPVDRAFPGINPDDLKRAELSLEFPNVKFDQSIDWTAWKFPNDANDLLVRRFTSEPPVNSFKILGKLPKPFELKDIDDKLIMDSREPKKSVSILCWINDDPVGEAVVKDLLGVRLNLEKRGLTTAARIVLVCSRNIAKPLTASLQKWNCDLPLAVDTDGSLTQLLEATSVPSIIVLGSDGRVQDAKSNVEPATVSSLPDTVDALAVRKLDLASRVIQLDLHNQSRYVAALHRTVIDKSQADRLPPIEEFPFLNHTMNRDWAVKFDEPIISAGGDNYNTTASVAANQDQPFASSRPTRIMSVLDAAGNVMTIDTQGERFAIGNIPIEQADGAKRLHMLVDPAMHDWIAIVPEGLPRFWMLKSPAASPKVDNVAPITATTFPIKNQSSPTAFAWTFRGDTPSLTITTDGPSVLVFDPAKEEVMEANSSKTVSIAPALKPNGEISEWNTVSTDGRLSKINNLPSSGSTSSISDVVVERLEQLNLQPETGAWLFGNHGKNPMLASLARLPSGETGLIEMDHLYRPQWYREITVRPEQARLWSSAATKDGVLFWLATGPREVLHLLTADGVLVDRASFGTKVIGAALYRDGNQLKMVVALPNEVSCWTMELIRN